MTLKSHLERLLFWRVRQVSSQPAFRQPVPDVTAGDVERIVRREFTSEQWAIVMALLSDFQTERRDRGAPRVQLAALKLAEGSLDKLRAHLTWPDYRDVLVAAEYPAYHKVGLRIRELSAGERQRIIDSDWSQYQEWLKRK
jgi:hypothetical protein